MEKFLTECAQSIIDGNAVRSAELARIALDDKHPVLEVIDKGFVKGIR